MRGAVQGLWVHPIVAFAKGVRMTLTDEGSAYFRTCLGLEGREWVCKRSNTCVVGMEESFELFMRNP